MAELTPSQQAALNTLLDFAKGKLAPIPPMDNAREGVIAYLRGCKYGLPKRSLTQLVWAFRSLTVLQREQLIHDLIEEGILQEVTYKVTYKTGTRSSTRLVLTGIRYHG